MTNGVEQDVNHLGKNVSPPRSELQQDIKQEVAHTTKTSVLKTITSRITELIIWYAIFIQLKAENSSK